MKTRLFRQFRQGKWVATTVLVLCSACSTVVPPDPGMTAGSLPPLSDTSTDNSTNTPAEARDWPTVTPRETLQLPRSLRDRLQAEVSPIPSSRRRADRLLQLLFDEAELDLNYRYSATIPPARVLEAGVGNCISLSLLVVAAAREVGLDARFQEVSTERNWNRVGSVFFMDRHINVRIRGILGRRDYQVDLRPTPARPDRPVRLITDAEAIAHFYNNLAAEALSRDSDREALARFRQALDSDPGVAFIWANLGTLYLRHDMPEAAERVLEQALALDPREYLAISNLAYVYRQQDRADEAATLESRAEHIRLRNPYYRAHLAESRLEEGHLEEAGRHLEQALKTGREDHVLQLLASRIYLAKGEYEQARRALTRARQLAEPGLSEEEQATWTALALQLDP